MGLTRSSNTIHLTSALSTLFAHRAGPTAFVDRGRWLTTVRVTLALFVSPGRRFRSCQQKIKRIFAGKVQQLE